MTIERITSETKTRLPAMRTYLEAFGDLLFPVGHLLEAGRAARHVDLQGLDLHPRLAMWLAKQYGKSGVYVNQRRMFELALRGESFVTTTRTGSGKSLGFMVPAFQEILQDPEARVIVYYPLRALGHDQTQKWNDMANELGFPLGTVQKLDGSVQVGERTENIARAKIILSNQDTLHAWFMSNLGNPAVLDFMSRVGLRIVDEAQMLSGVFGTNSLLLFRRFDHIQSLITPNYDPRKHRRYIGASGTLEAPTTAFTMLSGVKALHIGEDENGAPSHDKHILHLRYSREDLAHRVATNFDIEKQQGIIFFDSRAGVETLASEIKQRLVELGYPVTDETVIPYKSGLRPSDYSYIHRRINNGATRIVVSTSALEAGIDVDFGYGIAAGLPIDKSSLLQRMGRVGRRGPSTFIVLTANSKIREDYDLETYLRDAPLEAPIFYPTNRALLLSAALCLRSEMAAIAHAKLRPDKESPVQWPRGFGNAYKDAAKPHDTFAVHERHMIPPKRYGAYPQRHLPLRSIPSERFNLMQFSGKGGPPRVVGEVTAEQALREYTPGSIIRHMGAPYRVNRWEQEDGVSQIILSSYKGFNRTKVHVSERMGILLSPRNIISNQLMVQGDSPSITRGFICATTARVAMTATGFVEIARQSDGSTRMIRPYRYYDDYQLQNVREMAEDEVDYGPKRSISYYTNTVTWHVPEWWFGVHGRQDLGERIIRAYCDKNRIAYSDIGFMHKRIRINTADGKFAEDNTLVFYERAGNKIGLLQELPGDLRGLLLGIRDDLQQQISQRDRDAAQLLQTSLGRVENALRFVAGLKPAAAADIQAIVTEKIEKPVELPEGFIPVLEPQSEAQITRTRTILENVRILAPGLNPVDGKPGYWIQTVNRKKFYGQSAQWVTVRKSAIGVIYKKPPKARNDNAMVVNRFVPVRSIRTENPRPMLAMHVQTGKLFKIGRLDDGHVLLDPYRITDEATLSLLQRPQYG